MSWRGVNHSSVESRRRPAEHPVCQPIESRVSRSLEPSSSSSCQYLVQKPFGRAQRRCSHSRLGVISSDRCRETSDAAVGHKSGGCTGILSNRTTYGSNSSVRALVLAPDKRSIPSSSPLLLFEVAMVILLIIRVSAVK